MKNRSVLIAALVAIAVWPAIADAAQRGGHGGGGGGHGGGRAHVGGGGGFRGAHVRSGNARINNRAAVRAHNNRAAVRAHNNRAATRNRAHHVATRANHRATAAHLRAARAAQPPRRFGARYANNRWRYYHGPAWWGWRHGWNVGYVGWYGGLFWPFVYADVIGWAYWPWGYDPGYWYYAYDDFFDGVFYGNSFGNVAEPASRYAGRTAPPPQTNLAQARDLCKQPGNGVTAWPIDDIEKAVQPSEEQRKLLVDLKDVSEKAAQKFAVVCPSENDLAETAPGRLATIIGRLQATEDVIIEVKPALDAFYNSLSEEQKTRFDALGPKEANTASRQGRSTTGSAAPQGNKCGNVNAGLTDLPLQQIEAAVRPTEAQQDAFNELEDATAKAVAHLQANCPQQAATTPAARLDEMRTNVHAMIEAAQMIKPAMENFYTSLNDAQKARLNKLDKKMASAE